MSSALLRCVAPSRKALGTVAQAALTQSSTACSVSCTSRVGTPGALTATVRSIATRSSLVDTGTLMAWEEGEWDYRPEDYGRSTAPRRQAIDQETYGEKRAPSAREETGGWDARESESASHGRGTESDQRLKEQKNRSTPKKQQGSTVDWLWSRGDSSLSALMREVVVAGRMSKAAFMPHILMAHSAELAEHDEQDQHDGESENAESASHEHDYGRSRGSRAGAGESWGARETGRAAEGSRRDTEDRQRQGDANGPKRSRQGWSKDWLWSRGDDLVLA